MRKMTRWNDKYTVLFQMCLVGFLVSTLIFSIFALGTALGSLFAWF